MSTSSSSPTVLVVMGVAGSGKSTVGERVCEALRWEFRDGDSFHPPANVAKMHGGIPLTDEDRWPWLAAIASWIEDLRQTGKHGVVPCSALKRAYRDALRDGHDDVRFVYLEGSRELIGARMAARQDHFMPTSLLDSQFATLEPPGADEGPIVVGVDREPDAIVAAVVEAVALVRG